tara:strand:- start:394 stop:588 length:195 start_codon:yes stop_codon:yes gene_type:complete
MKLINTILFVSIIGSSPYQPAPVESDSSTVIVAEVKKKKKKGKKISKKGGKKKKGFFSKVFGSK